MEDKTFTRILEKLNQRALQDITDETLRCWVTIQQGATLASATAHIENEYMRESVKHVLLYVLLQSLLFDARQRQMIDRKRYEDLKGYIDTLAKLVHQQPFKILPLPTT